MDALFQSIDVDRAFCWSGGTALRLAKRGLLPHVVLPDGSIRFDEAVFGTPRRVQARCQACGVAIDSPPLCGDCAEGVQ